jgi:GntR family transcriptional regulator
LAVEIGAAIGRHVPHSGCDGASEKLRANTCVLSIEAHLLQIAKLLPGSSIRPIRLKSMQEMLMGQQRPSSAVLIAVASRSASILRWATTLIAALGFSADAVLLRDAGMAHWQDGLGACDIVAADVVTAAELSRAVRPIVFSLVAEEFLVEMRQFVTA